MLIKLSREEVAMWSYRKKFGHGVPMWATLQHSPEVLTEMAEAAVKAGKPVPEWAAQKPGQKEGSAL